MARCIVISWRLVVLFGVVFFIAAPFPSNFSFAEEPRPIVRPKPDDKLIEQVQYPEARGDWRGARETYQQLLDGHPDSRHVELAKKRIKEMDEKIRAAQFADIDVGTARDLRQEGYHDAAIHILKRLLPGEDGKYGDATIWAHGGIAREISICYQAKEDYVQAVYWFRQFLINRKHYYTWCGTGIAERENWFRMQLISLMISAGEEDGLLAAERTLYGSKYLGYGSMPFMVVDGHHQRGRLEELKSRLTKAKKSGWEVFKSYKVPDLYAGLGGSYRGGRMLRQLISEEESKEVWKRGVGSGFTAVGIALSYIEIVEARDAGDVASLWNRVLAFAKNDENARSTDILTAYMDRYWKLEKPVLALRAIPGHSIPYLKSKLGETSIEQAWAYTVLVSMGVEGLEDQLEAAIVEAEGYVKRRKTGAGTILYPLLRALLELDLERADVMTKRLSKSDDLSVASSATTAGSHVRAEQKSRAQAAASQ